MLTVLPLLSTNIPKTALIPGYIAYIALSLKVGLLGCPHIKRTVRCLDATGFGCLGLVHFTPPDIST